MTAIEVIPPLRNLEHALAELESFYLSSRTTPFFLLGVTLRNLVRGEGLSCKRIEAGIMRQNILPADSAYGKAMRQVLATKKNGKLDYKMISYISESGVPVEIKIIEKDAKFFQFPSEYFYNAVFPHPTSPVVPVLGQWDLERPDNGIGNYDFQFYMPNPVKEYLASIDPYGRIRNGGSTNETDPSLIVPTA